MTEERAKRKLRAFLSADAVGYSRLMQEDEASTIRAVEKSKRLMSELIGQFKGRVVDAPGDNLLAEFASVVDATDCVVKIQGEQKTKNVELPDNRQLKFRIGVNLGDVVAQTNQHLWAERYDRNLKDIFAVQDEITKKIITELQIHLTAGEEALLWAKGTNNLEAYLKYLQGIEIVANDQEGHSSRSLK